MADQKSDECAHGNGLRFYCWRCIEEDGGKPVLDEPKKFTTFAKVGRDEMREITRGAEWEFKVEGVPAMTPRRRLTLRLSETEAEVLFKYAYLPSAGILVKYKLRKALIEAFGSFMMDLIDATGLPILILPWGDPIGSWQAEG